MTWGSAGDFTGYSGFFHQLGNHDLAAVWQKGDEKRNSKLTCIIFVEVNESKVKEKKSYKENEYA